MLMMKYSLLLILSLLLLNCETQPNTLSADTMIQKSMEDSGVNKLNSSILSFDFRDIHYVAIRANGSYEFQRIQKDSSNVVRDILNNKGFERFINDSLVVVPDSMATKYASSVNSVHYFAVLPYSLDGKAVNKTYLGDVKIKDKTYYKIKVTFNEDGGGEDFDDVFIYWIHSENSKIDYLAYSFKEDDGIGLRFREAYNERYINGVRFVDYNNFKPKDKTSKLENLDVLFNENQLELLSKIELENISLN